MWVRKSTMEQRAAPKNPRNWAEIQVYFQRPQNWGATCACGQCRQRAQRLELVAPMIMTDREVRSFVGRFSNVTIALVCAGFSILFLILCVLAGLHFRRAVEQEFYRETGNIAQILMADFDDDAATADAILTRLAAQIPPDAVSSANEAELYKLLSGNSLQSSMLGPGNLDRNGTRFANPLGK